MKFITVRDLKIKTRDVWTLLNEEGDVIITSNGKPIAILSDLTDGDVETSLAVLRRSRAVMAVNKLQRRAVEKGVNNLTNKEIEEEIHSVHKDRHS